jgi:proteasome lid subunit RPN8/RPN11
MERLTEFYAGEGKERIGFILKSGAVVELENKSPEPYSSAFADPEFLLANENELLASFHTHPGGSKNLSGDDYQAFCNWPDLKHYIVGKDGIACYVVKNGTVIHEDENRTARGAS